MVKIEAPEDAVRHRFQGSPTIRINDRDVVEHADTEYGLRCRTYWVEGQPQGHPDTFGPPYARRDDAARTPATRSVPRCPETRGRKAVCPDRLVEAAVSQRSPRQHENR